MTPQEALDSNGCVACLTPGEQETLITYAALQWLSWLEMNGSGGGGAVTTTAQDALSDGACVDCLTAEEKRTIRAIAALEKLQWIEDNP